ncbi:BREX system P-loop protein BrxC [Weeksellaceae bacterium KMM 9724]|uniref:BREX system P-loop protein BrxC n=1 Tax=Profundicola chukchiensis TaxID=2961959 RepID=UPI00243C0761|nr:BREX system P-loop protein BrxC [Profundicola chukchiensis]MDG4950732.1 BREX system P-loop protein BrxC [Profundicola chukchiensis]
MKTINDILKLDLQEDIKNVIDLEDKSQDEIQSEIESYIITDGLGHHLSKFINEYTSNIKETGVWLSGFYGSGKSYFGKMLGYLIDNPDINGTSARDRFLPRLEGVANQSLIENDIRKLDAIQSKVIFLDIAKQNTDNGLAFTLFANFLKSLGFRDDIYGYIEYDLFIEGRYNELEKFSLENFNKEWREIKKSNREVARTMRRAFLSMGYTDEEFQDMQNTYSFAIQNYDSERFKEELKKYLEKFPDENLVFVFDEASEALSQGKFKITDLQALSESLSSIERKVWTIAIAQEKLDSVINNANVNKSHLTKVTDRFKTKIHLESTEVDVIIKNRLLLKKEEAFEALVNYYKDNEGSISDITNLKSTFPTKTQNAKEFATYYPFHKYQFDLLQKFLFSSNALVATQIAARGMIITTFDVLRKEMRNRELYSFTTAHDLCDEAQTAPPADLSNKYHIAKKIIENSDIDLDGELLLKTLHFLGESELASPNVENITKSYIADASKYYEVKPKVEEALEILVESKLLIVSNHLYKITSNLEGKLLEEMNDFDVELFIKKRELITYLKKSTLFRQVSVLNDGSVAYNFNILSDLDDEIVGSKNKNLRLTAYSLFNINENRQDFIESLKLDTQYRKDLITLVPENSRFQQIDKLLEEVKKYGYMEEKYGNDDDANKRQIIGNFTLIREEKEKDLINLIEQAYANGSLIYLFDETILSPEDFKSSINEVQRKLIKNNYTKRLSTQLSDKIGENILSETNNTNLNRYFSGEEFNFFDANGNFVGEHLKLIEEITAKLGNRYIDGKSLEEELALAPWGYAYGTISTALAVLFRAGRLIIKYNDTEFYSYQDRAAKEVFSSSTKFKTARFKSISKALSSTQKNEIIQSLIDLDFEKHTDKSISWNVSDFEVSMAITQLAEHFISSLNTIRNTQSNFDKLFANIVSQKEVLQHYTAKTTESNFIEKAEEFLNTKSQYRDAIKNILKAEKFIKNNLDKIKGYQRFVTQVNNELTKAGINNQSILDSSNSFNKAMDANVIKNFADLQSAAQAIKDEYHGLMSSNAKEMKAAYKEIYSLVQEAQKELQDYPEELNLQNKKKLKALLEYAQSKLIDDVQLEFHTECQKSKYSLSDIINYKELAPNKKTELVLLKSNFIKEKPDPVSPEVKTPKKLKLGVNKNVMTVLEYRNLLSAQIQAMAGMRNDEEVEVTITSN